MRQRSRLHHRRQIDYCQCGHSKRPQVSTPGTSYTRCRLCTRQREAPFVRLKHRLTELEHEWKRPAWATGPDRDWATDASARHYRRLLRLAWRLPGKLTGPEMSALDDGETPRSSPAIRVKEYYGSRAAETPCTASGVPHPVSGNHTVKVRVFSGLPKVAGAFPLAACDEHWPIAVEEAERRLRAKWPETQWTLRREALR